MEIRIKKTNELSVSELLTIFQERVAVFVVEQQCPYQEVDADDRDAWHVSLCENDQLKAYARVMLREDHVTFGRVLVVDKFRRQGLGEQLVQAVLADIRQRFPKMPIKISAQSYLQDFYSRFGFKATSEIYLEDGIPHLDMLKNA
ncbi:acetyltransferase [Enterococcus florum]|uniref:Acetyltransferase n=1 Tax=Enterococcus florum TaxID=2480627 RepID=A0A4P5PA39_9ENTE|nr:GNAT family N-acetyltransferase [Enterococcus florum]GCF94810.1 acetyltransferase [Enterococcus florum]